MEGWKNGRMEEWKNGRLEAELGAAISSSGAEVQAGRLGSRIDERFKIKVQASAYPCLPSFHSFPSPFPPFSPVFFSCNVYC